MFPLAGLAGFPFTGKTDRIKNDGSKEELFAQVNKLLVGNKITGSPAESPDGAQPLAIGANSF